MRIIRIISFGIQVILGFLMIASLMEDTILLGGICLILFVGITLGTDKFFPENISREQVKEN